VTGPPPARTRRGDPSYGPKCRRLAPPAVCDNSHEMTTDRHDNDLPGHDGAVAHHATDDHGEDHGHDDHAHDATDPLGPIVAFVWGAGILGVGLGLVVALAFALSTEMM
jgi:hypothetical protein